MTDHSPSIKFVTDRDVAIRYQIARSTVWYLVRQGKLPTPEKLSKNVTRWRIEDLDAFDSSRKEG